jgi:hypothetical protein
MGWGYVLVFKGNWMCKWVDLPPVITAIDSGHIRVELYSTGPNGTELQFKYVMPRSAFVAGLTMAQNVDERMRRDDAEAYIASLPRTATG